MIIKRKDRIRNKNIGDKLKVTPTKHKMRELLTIVWPCIYETRMDDSKQKLRSPNN